MRWAKSLPLFSLLLSHGFYIRTDMVCWVFLITRQESIKYETLKHSGKRTMLLWCLLEPENKCLR